MRDSQLTMARYLRDPANNPPPAGVEERRLKVYKDLVYNNIEGFISGGFPVLRSLYTDADWHGLVRLFIDQHRCQSPYFLEISQEFIGFLMQDFPARAVDPPFIAELAHYEWVELALDTAGDELPEPVPVENVLQAVLQLSPLAWSLAYRYPVHRIGSGFGPTEPGEPTYLVVYRNRADEVRFMELNDVTARLLEKLRDNRSSTSGAILEALADETGMDRASIVEHGSGQLRELLDLDVLVVQTAS